MPHEAEFSRVFIWKEKLLSDASMRVAVMCLFVWGLGREWEGLLFGEV
jgi:hypothetical protein